MSFSQVRCGYATPTASIIVWKWYGRFNGKETLFPKGAILNMLDAS